MADEFMDKKLEESQAYWGRLKEMEEESTFKARRQLVYVADFRWAHHKTMDIPLAIFEIQGAEEDNKHCETAVFFRLTNKREELQRFRNFLRGLKVKTDTPLVELEGEIEKIKRHIFEADVELRPGKEGGKMFVNIKPLHFKKGEITKNEVPF